MGASDTIQMTESSKGNPKILKFWKKKKDREKEEEGLVMRKQRKTNKYYEKK